MIDPESESRRADETTKPAAIQLQVDTSRLRPERAIWHPEALRLAQEIAGALLSQAQFIHEEEVLVAEVSEFPGLAEIGRFESGRAIASFHVHADLLLDIIQVLSEQDILAEMAPSGVRALENPNTTFFVRLARIHDGTSYGQDEGRTTYSYQKSIWQVFFRRVTPSEYRDFRQRELNRAAQHVREILEGRG